MASKDVDFIKEAIAGLAEEGRLSLAAWLNLQTMDAWERQMQQDFSPGGRGAKFVEEVRREIAEGGAGSLDEGFAKRRRRS